ncbi:hypothetical protein VB620_14070 [Nodularia harveyana UHCC-0300]|uniref:Uncharacterized protein n=1 Tax=Nodularia harveyana UHCC-0300 TaxID=2974287 RepID=A0ABU5UFX5_9CYAN|nr:hypothetical protein [Nodularia harveyana]MEA5582462.1 hypothetical protein [Nodularia harveyana UHCC-0300]
MIPVTLTLKAFYQKSGFEAPCSSRSDRLDLRSLFEPHNARI